MRTYRPEIDGLRAVAIIPVVLFHLNVPLMSGGYLGVDVFFVISGFLITQILLGELLEENFSIRNFWGRRIRRIMPVLLLVVFTSLIVARATGPVHELRFVGEQATAALLFYANLYFQWNVGNYWGPTAEQSVLLHTWSLAVEEQFYLIYPWILMGLLRWIKRWSVGVLAALGLLSYLSFSWQLQLQSNAAFYALPCRGWQLMSGACLATWMHQRGVPIASQWSDRFPGWGLALIAWGVFSGYAGASENANAVAVVGGATLLLAGPPTGTVVMFLSRPTMTWIGKLSYSLYLWHWPWIVWGSRWIDDASSWWLLPPIVVTSLVSYFGFEQPIRRRSDSVGWILLAMTIGIVVAIGASRPSRYASRPTQAMQRPHWNGSLYDLSPRRDGGPWLRRLDQAGVHIAQHAAGRSPNLATAYRDSGWVIGSHDRPTPRWVVLGDSHAAMWSDSIASLARSEGITTSFWSVHGVDPFMKIPPTRSGASGVLTADEKLAYDVARSKAIRQWKPDVVIVSARWLLWPSDAPNPLIDFLAQHAKHVLIVGVVAESDIGDQLVVTQLDATGHVPRPDHPMYLRMLQPQKLRNAERRLTALASQYDNVRLVPMLDLFAQGDTVLVAVGDQTIYLDDDHLTQFGAEIGFRRIEALLRQWYPAEKLSGSPSD